MEDTGVYQKGNPIRVFETAIYLQNLAPGFFELISYERFDPDDYYNTVNGIR